MVDWSIPKPMKWVLSLLVLLVLIWYVNPAKIWDQIHLVTPTLLAVCVIGVILGQTIIIFSQYLSLRAFHPISFRKLISYSLSSWVSELFLPGKLGVFSLAYFLRKEGIGIGESMGVILLLRILNAIFALMLAIIGISSFLDFSGTLPAVVGMGVGLVVLVFIFFTQKGRELLKQYVLRKHAAHFQGFSATTKKIFSNTPCIVGVVILSGLGVLVQGVVGFLLFNLSGYAIPLLTIMSIYALIQIIIQVPLSINGWGIREGLMVAFFAHFGVPGEAALLLSTVNTAVAYGAGLLVSMLAVKETLN